jgi:hypothetical protein
MEVDMKVELIIPKLDNDGSDNSKVIESAIVTMCETFGGATAYDANGFWVNENGKLYKDAVTVLIAAAIENKAAHDEAITLAKRVLASTDQEAVFVSVHGKAEIIS